MKFITIIFICLCFYQLVVNAQNKTDSPTNIRIIDTLENGTFEIKELSSDSILLYKGILSSINPEVRSGKYYFFYENGLLAATGQYNSDIPVGEWIAYDESYDTISIVHYNKTLNFLMHEDNSELSGDVLYLCEQMPSFNEGDPSVEFRKYISDNIIYPPYAYFKGIQGRVIIQFAIDTAGNVRNPEIVRGVQTDLNVEALRIISESPQWTPGYQRAKPTNVLYTWPINFFLSTPKSIEEPKSSNEKKIGRKKRK